LTLRGRAKNDDRVSNQVQAYNVTLGHNYLAPESSFSKRKEKWLLDKVLTSLRQESCLNSIITPVEENRFCFDLIELKMLVLLDPWALFRPTSGDDFGKAPTRRTSMNSHPLIISIQYKNADLGNRTLSEPFRSVKLVLKCERADNVLLRETAL